MTVDDHARGWATALRRGHYMSVVASTEADGLIRAFVTGLHRHVEAASSTSVSDDGGLAAPAPQTLILGLAALDAFLQANVTGPVLVDLVPLETRLAEAWADLRPANGTSTPAPAGRSDLEQLRKTCLRVLEVDGVSPYAYIPYLELFCLARHALTSSLPHDTPDIFEISSEDGPSKYSIAWTKLRINVWHYKLLTQPSLGSGSNFTRSSQWSDVPTLAAQIIDGIDAVRKQVLSHEVWASDDTWSRDDQVQFLLEAANNYILLGRDDKAKEALAEASHTSGLLYALSGALGKRTKFQEKSTSQLVVLAKSGANSAAADDEQEAKPDALQLNDDTLLEQIHFTKENDHDAAKEQEPPICPS